MTDGVWDGRGMWIWVVIAVLVVDTKNWWVGKHILVLPQWINGLNESDGKSRRFSPTCRVGPFRGRRNTRHNLSTETTTNCTSIMIGTGIGPMNRQPKDAETGHAQKEFDGSLWRLAGARVSDRMLKKTDFR